jgi:hypothetical protein
MLSVVVAAMLCSNAYAETFEIRPLHFLSDPGFNIVATGTIGTSGASGVINDWNLQVVTTEKLAHYSKANTVVNLSQVFVSSSGHVLSVATSPDPAAMDGGFLGFQSPSPFVDLSAVVADFTGANADGGGAMYLAGSAFDFLSLLQPMATNYAVAQNNGNGNLYDLTPIDFANGVSLTGQIRTDGTKGELTASNIRDWSIDVTQVTIDRFNPTNSVLVSNQSGLTSDGKNIAVTNPDGELKFVHGSAGGHIFGLTLADFTTSTFPVGQARYDLGRFASYSLDLYASNGQWLVTGSQPVAVPEPCSLILIVSGVAAFAGWAKLRICVATLG